MAEATGKEGLSKAAKKNLKRRAAKKKAEAIEKHQQYLENKQTDELTAHEVKDLLNEQLEEAKKNKDNEAAKKIREKIWVVNDMIAGVKTDIADQELQKILDSLPITEALKLKAGGKPTNSNTVKVKENTQEKPSGQVDSSEKNIDADKPSQNLDRRLRNLKKKLFQIEKIKEKVSNNENVEKSQLEKVKTEAAILAEIEDLELDITALELNR